MGRPYSIDLRERVLSPELEHLPSRLVAERFGLAPSTVINWRRRYRDKGKMEADRMGGYKPLLLAVERDWLLQRVADEPDVTISRLQAELDDRGLSVCWSTVWYFLNREGLSFKKNRIRRRTEPA